MINALIELLIVIIVVGIVAGLIIWIVEMLPFPDPRWKQIARVLIVLIAVLIVLMRALPMLGVAVA